MKWPKQPTIKLTANYVKSYNAMREEVRQGVSPLPSIVQLRNPRIMLPWPVAKPMHVKHTKQIGGPRPKRS